MNAGTDTSKVTDQALFNTLDDMYALTSGALSRICGAARCALLAIESEAIVNHLEAIAQVLTAIALDADMTLNDVAVEAEKHGITTTDRARSKRHTAMCKARSNMVVTSGGQS